MTMNGGIMESQRQAAAWLSGPPISTFAGLPAPSAAPRAIYRLSDVRNTLWESNGTIWRPLGGRQVLAQRSVNPVTVQDLAGAVAETIGPFPGGLVRAGMRLEYDLRVNAPGVGGGGVSAYTRIGSGAIRNILSEHGLLTGVDNRYFRGAPMLDVLSDTNTTHASYYAGANAYAGSNYAYLAVVDFSLDWSTDIFLKSVAETAVNITSASWAAGVATFGTSAAHTLAVGDKTVIAGVTPSGYNVAAGAIVLSVPTTTSFTVAIASNPGAYTSGGTSSRISNMISQSYVLELVG